MNGQPDDTQPAAIEAGDVNETTGLPVLRSLAVAAPANAFPRFHRRATLMQGTRMLFESQVTGFWVVLDAFLSLLLGGGQHAKQGTAQRNRA